MRYPFFFGIAVSGVIQTGSLFYPPRGASSKKKRSCESFFSPRESQSGGVCSPGMPASPLESKITGQEESNGENANDPFRPSAPRFQAAARNRHGTADPGAPSSGKES